jgi:hypothetical protein
MNVERTKTFQENERSFLRPLIWIIFIVESLAVTALFSGCVGSGLARKGGYTPGVYEGSGKGYRGTVEVRVQVSPAGIDGVEITGHNERYPGVAAMEELLETVLEYGSTDVDVVSGATCSGRGFLEAVENALKKARSRE